MKLKNLLANIPYKNVEGSMDIDIDGIYYDSRLVTPGSIFFCIEGFKVDGHDFAHQAVKNGAAAVVLKKDVHLPEGITKIFVENVRRSMALTAASFYRYPADEVTLVGVTGTNGKTTVTYLIKSILEKNRNKTGLIGTINNMIGDKKIPSNRTTPESVDLQKLFRQMVDENVDNIVMEVSSHSLSLDRVAGCIFDVGIFTNLTQDHLDFHVTLENYRNAKAKLFAQSKISIINADDEGGRQILKEIDGVRLTYGIKNHADVYATDLDITAKGSKFKLYIKDNSCEINLKNPGIFSVYNALAASAACYSLGIPIEIIKSGLAESTGVPGRFELLHTDTDYSVILDYAHTPDGLINVLSTAREITKGRLITVFGCGGDRDATKRPLMGEAAGNLSDFCIITSDNPRTEDPMSIIQNIIPGIEKTRCPYVVIENRHEAIAHALSFAKPQDVIILAGKGHETYQILKDKTIHFDEKEIVAELLGKEKV